jgi:hypothetical protein
MPLAYNEPAWNQDVATHITIWASSANSPIKSAGGQYGTEDAEGKLFPDVLLFGDGAGSLVIQGWELKFPDTAITDQELLRNAIRKAETLSLPSFVVWNVCEAALWVKSGSAWESRHSWSLGSRPTRDEVHSADWRRLLDEMLGDISDFITAGTIRTAAPIDILSSETFSGFVRRHSNAVRAEISAEVGTDAGFRDDVAAWWDTRRDEATGADRDEVLANGILISWIARIVLAHVIRTVNTGAAIVDDIGRTSSVDDALEVFGQIASTSDYQSVFRAHLGEYLLPQSTWEEAVEINEFLKSIRLRGIDPRLLDSLLGVVTKSARKEAGQFSTPRSLATLMAGLAISNVSLPFIDPCCGTGTVARAALDLKQRLGLSGSSATETVWASDKFEGPLRLATLAMSVPENRSQVLQVFKCDAASLHVGMPLDLTDPDNGEIVKRFLPEIDALASNLPFVKQDRIDALNPGLRNRVNEMLESEGLSLEGKSDLYAYLPFALRNVMASNGRLVLLTSNSWLSSEWGQSFFAALETCFRVVAIVISGHGRWFADVKVVTTLIILEMPTMSGASHDIRFIVTEMGLDELTATPSDLDATVAAVRSGQGQRGRVRVATTTRESRALARDKGLSITANFAGVGWLSSLRDNLVPVSDHLDVGRGRRRGWNPMFIPEHGHGIEEEYLFPLLKSSKGADYEATPDAEAFCCSRSEAELENLGHTGALNWINTFRNQRNGKGRPLPEVLAESAPSGGFWFEMRTDGAMADMTISLNPGSRLFVSRLTERSFVDQRLIALRGSSQTDLDLCHALLNSVVGQFLLEAAGFGRGDGALDLHSDAVKKRLQMLDPSTPTGQQRTNILTAFEPVRSRAVLPVPQELEDKARSEFDREVARAFGFENSLEGIRSSLLELYNIRHTVLLDR